MDHDKLNTICAIFLQTIGGLVGIGLICAGFDQRTNPGLPIAGAIILFTLVYAEINSRR